MLDFLNQFSVLPSWTSVLLALISGLGIWFLVDAKTKWQSLPPGPYGLPFFGYFPFLGKEPPFVSFSKLSEKHGDVISVNILGTNVVILNSYEAIRECFVTKGNQFSGKVVNEKSFFWWIVDGLGIAQDEGPTWQEHRRFALHTLRDFGFGKLSLEARVQEIGQDLVSGLESTKGQSYDPQNLIANCTINVILYLVAGKRFPTDDPDFLMVRENVRILLRRLSGLSAFIPTPLVKILPMSWHPGFSELLELKKRMHGLANKFVKEHEARYDENNLSDFVDVFLAEMKAAEKEGRQKDSSFTVARLQAIFLNLLMAGSETTSTLLRWAVKILADRPEVQEKIQRELDEVVGRERLPSILDRANLPYTEAFLLEVQRYSSIAPIGLPHSNPVPETLRGFNIPARSVVIANLWAVHNDPKNWTQPAEFDPDRFLNPDHQNKSRERVIPFSIGKRSCLGESLARMEMFLFLTMMMQRFTFRPSSVISSTKLLNSFVRVLPPFQICVEPRK